MENKTVRLIRRYDGDKRDVAWEGLEELLINEFDHICKGMYDNAASKVKEKQKVAYDWKTFMEHLNNGCMILTPWCGESEVEEQVKTKSGEESQALTGEEAITLTGKAKTLCGP